MMEILASKNGEPLLVNPNSKIDVMMASMQPRIKTISIISTVKKQWVYKGGIRLGRRAV
jgi:hypothetical protein